MRRLLALFLLFFATVANATTFTDLKFGRYQVADSQWNVSACMYTNTCQIYSTNPGTMYKIPWYSGQWSWQNGQYVQFSLTGGTANPYEGKVYNSDGSYAGTIGIGRIINMGTDSNGRSFFFFVGYDNNTGQLFSTNYGMTGNSGYTWTGTLNPTTTQLNTFAGSGSTAPLSSGQTYTSTPTYPTVTVSNSQQNKINQTTALSNNSIYIDNYGNYNSVTIEQTGYYNSVRGMNGSQYATINGNNNTLTVKQGGVATPSNNNLAEISVLGVGNNVDINQKQTNKYIETSINGNSNILNVTQHGTNSKSAFVNLSSSSNTISLTQQGTGNHFVDISSPYGGANVSITQDGSAQKLFSLILNSSNVGVTITQNNPNTSDSAVMSITCSTPPCTGYSYTKN